LFHHRPPCLTTTWECLFLLPPCRCSPTACCATQSPGGHRSAGISSTTCAGSRTRGARALWGQSRGCCTSGSSASPLWTPIAHLGYDGMEQRIKAQGVENQLLAAVLGHDVVVLSLARGSRRTPSLGHFSVENHPSRREEETKPWLLPLQLLCSRGGKEGTRRG
jgi:hypothetical protein